MYVTYAGCND